MYDRIEVLFFHKPGSDKEESLARLQQAIGPNFKAEGREFIDANFFSNCKQVVRIAAASLEPFTSPAEFEASVRNVASEEDFPWTRFGVVPVGKAESITK